MGANIKLEKKYGGYQTFNNVSEVELPTSDGGTQVFAIGGTQPQLNTPSIIITQNTLNISNPASNGNFVSGYKVFADGDEIDETASVTYDLATGVTGNEASITVKAKGVNFQDSDESTAATFYRHYTVTMYDDDETTVLDTELVKYGEMPEYVPTKTGYRFSKWVDENGDPVTEIVADTDIYATYTNTITIPAGVYAFNDESQRSSFEIDFTTPSNYSCICYEGDTVRYCDGFKAYIRTNMGDPPYPMVVFQKNGAVEYSALTRLETTSATIIKWATHPTYGLGLSQYRLTIYTDWVLGLTQGDWFNEIFYKVEQ